MIFATLGLKFFTRGMLSVSAVVIGIGLGYLYALAMGMVTFEGIATSWSRAATVALPVPFAYGFEFSFAAVIGFCLMAFVSAVATVGDVSGITTGCAGREATDTEITGATYADGLGSAIAGVFGGVHTTPDSPKVRRLAMTALQRPDRITVGHPCPNLR